MKTHIIYTGWEMALPVALKPDVHGLLDNKGELSTWYVILDIPKSLWDGVAGGVGIHQADSIEMCRNSFPKDVGELNIYSDWTKSKESVRFATRIRIQQDIDKLSTVGIVPMAVENIHIAIKFEQDHRHQFTHERIVERTVEEYLERIRTFRAAGDIPIDAHQDLFCWAYGNRTELFEDAGGRFVHHLGRLEDDFVGFCKRNLKSAVVESIGTKVPDSTFYRIRVDEKDAFTIKMFTHEA